MINRHLKQFVKVALLTCFLMVQSHDSLIAEDGVEVVSRLIYSVTNPTSTEEARLKAISELGLIGEQIKHAVPVLVNSMDLSGPDGQAAIIQALGRIGPSAEASVPALTNLFSLQSTSNELKMEIAAVLGGIGSGASDAVPLFLEALKEKPERTFRYSLIVALGQIGDPRAIPAFTESMDYYVMDEFAPHSIPVLIQALGSEDEEVRRGASHALGRIGKHAVPDLLEALQSASSEVRYQALSALDYIQRTYSEAGSEIATHLIPLINDPDIQVRLQAITCLYEMEAPPEKFLESILPLLKDPSPEVRQTAVRAFIRIRGNEAALLNIVELLDDPIPEVRADAATSLSFTANPEQAIPLLIELLSDPSSIVRRSSAGALGRFGEAAQMAIPDLIRLFEDEDRVVTWAALALSGYTVIPGIGVAALEPLRQALKSDVASVRLGAAVSLGRLEVQGCPAVPDLIKTLKDENEEVRHYATIALGRIGPCASSAVSDLITQMTQGSEKVQIASITALGEIQEPSSIPFLMDFISDLISQEADSGERLTRSTVTALGQFGGRAEEAVPILAHILQNYRGDFIRQKAAIALGEIGSEQAVSALLNALESVNEYLRLEILQVMRGLGPEVRQAAPALMSIMKSTAGLEQVRAAWVLGQMEPDNEAVIGLLISLVHSESPRVAEEAIQALGEIGPPASAAVYVLIRRVTESDAVGIQFRAVDSLRQMGSPLAVPAMMVIMRNSGSRARYNAAWAIASIAKQNLNGPITREAEESALELLIAKLDDRRPEWRGYAVEALGDLGAARAIPKLQAMLKDPTPYVRVRVEKALQHMTSEP